MRISDWSSDVCSSDLMRPYTEAAPLAAFFLGISSGFPYAMIGATLTTRLACRLAPESATNALELGRLQAATGDFDGARRSFGQATQLDPALFDAWFLLGVTYMREERQAQALPFLRQAHQLQPTHPDATRALADAEFDRQSTRLNSSH